MVLTAFLKGRACSLKGSDSASLGLGELHQKGDPKKRNLSPSMGPRPISLGGSPFNLVSTHGGEGAKGSHVCDVCFALDCVLISRRATQKNHHGKHIDINMKYAVVYTYIVCIYIYTYIYTEADCLSNTPTHIIFLRASFCTRSYTKQTNPVKVPSWLPPAKNIFAAPGAENGVTGVTGTRVTGVTAAEGSKNATAMARARELRRKFERKFPDSAARRHWKHEKPCQQSGHGKIKGTRFVGRRC